MKTKISSGTAASFPTWPKWCLSLYEFPRNHTQAEGKTPSIHTSALTHPIPPSPSIPTHPTPIQTNHSTTRDPFETKPSPKVTIRHHVGPSKVAAEGPSLHHLQHLHWRFGRFGRTSGTVGCPGLFHPYFIASTSHAHPPYISQKTDFTKKKLHKIDSRIDFIQKYPRNCSTKFSRFFLCLLDTVCLVHPHFLTVHLQTSHSISI